MFIHECYVFKPRTIDMSIADHSLRITVLNVKYHVHNLNSNKNV